MIDFFGNGLCLHCHLAKNELTEFTSFNDLTEDTWKVKDDTLQDKLNEILAKYPEKNHADIVESYSWDLHLTQYKYPSLHRESLIISIFNFLEHQLNALCEIMYESIDSPLKLKDMHGQGVERTLLFLSKVAKIDFSTFGAVLPMIKGVNLVRNIIVHNGGYLPDDSKLKINSFVTRTKYLSGIGGESIMIRPEFIGQFISVLQEFFEMLDQEVQKHIQLHIS
tara:strand:- start:279537 stop:280205 length:669 start_codon:yes stop_codon:yes gene_type:complete